MKTIEELEQQIKDIQLEIDELKKSKEWKPTYGEFYYSFNDCEICYVQWLGDKWDNDRCSKHAIYKTHDEAESDFKFLIAYRKIRDKAKELNEGWVPDWNNDNIRKYCIKYDHPTNKFKVDSWLINNLLPLDVCFLSRELAQQAIQELGEQVLKDFFKIK